MNYQQFVKAIEQSVRESLSDGMSIQIHHVTKNNGNEKVGLTISEPGINLSPTIYLEEYYEEYLSGEAPEDIVTRILAMYQDVKFERSWDTDFLKEYSSVRGHIVYKLIHAKRNEALLQKVPHRLYLDLAIVCYVLLELRESGTATVLVTNELLKIWQTDEETVFADAEKNTENLLPEKFCTMSAIICDLCNCTLHFPEENERLHVLTNQRYNLGAAGILYRGILKRIGEKLQDNYYVIPSSIHEVIIIPEHFSPDKQALEQMIREVNETAVEAEEVLSDKAYFYDRNTNQLIL